MKPDSRPAASKPLRQIPSAKPGAHLRGRQRGVNTRLSMHMLKRSPSFIQLSDPPKGTA